MKLERSKKFYVRIVARKSTKETTKPMWEGEGNDVRRERSKEEKTTTTTKRKQQRATQVKQYTKGIEQMSPSLWAVFLNFNLFKAMVIVWPVLQPCRISTSLWNSRMIWRWHARQLPTRSICSIVFWGRQSTDTMTTPIAPRPWPFLLGSMQLTINCMFTSSWELTELRGCTTSGKSKPKQEQPVPTQARGN